jgi:PAS domain S-box-containing protein
MPGELNHVLHDPERLGALHRLRLLDTPAEEPFDRLTRLAARVVGAPVSLVSLVDDQRQFFKSACGLPEPLASRRETPLSLSFCKHVVANGEALVVEDARDHPLLRHNLAVRDLGVVAYLGMPLLTPEGQIIGSFCAIDLHRRKWSQGEQETMRELAASVMSEVALRAANQAMEHQVRIRTAELSAANVALKEIEARYLSLVENSPQGVVIHQQGLIVYANSAMNKICGCVRREELLGREFAEALAAPEEHAKLRQRQAARYAGMGGPASTEWRGIRKDNREIWLSSSGTLIEWQGQPAILSFCVDITGRKRSEAHQRRLIAELDHRVKNVLARVSSVLAFTYVGAPSMDAFAEALEGRIQSLARAHQLLSRSSWQGVGVATLVEGQLAPYVAMDRAAIDGPDVLLTADATQALASLLHELVTNAAKHGALKTALGRVSVSWRIVEALVAGRSGRHLVIEWQETGGPVVEGPTRQGFGTRMIRELTSFELGGEADLVFAPQGVHCTFTVPLARVSPII